MLRYLFFFVGLISFWSSSQIEEVRRITETLCSEAFHGRGYVNQGDSIAAEFIASEFQKIGAEQIKGSYFQDFSFPVNSFPGAMEVKIGGKSLVPGEDFVVSPNSPEFKGTLKPFRIDPELASDTDELVEKLKSILSSDAYNAVFLDFASATGDTLKNLRGLKYELAQMIHVVESTSSKFTWSVAQVQAPYLTLEIQDSVISDFSSIEVNVEAKLINNHHTRNVIATIPAKRKCKKTIVFTAHYDHLGQMGTATYFPGANDNASGTAMLLSMAKYFKENPVDYNVVFIAFAGEEAGLLGSKYYVEHPLFPLKKIKFLINLDIMGSGEEGITVVNGTLFQKEFHLLEVINTEMDLLQQVKVRGPAANSDHYWFTEKGVPAFFIYTMGLNKNYHDVFDKYENLTFVEYDDITTLLVQFVERL